MPSCGQFQPSLYLVLRCIKWNGQRELREISSTDISRHVGIVAKNGCRDNLLETTMFVLW